MSSNANERLREMSKKNYVGYRSYSYLKDGEDYQAIPLAKEIDRVPSAKVELSDAEYSDTDTAKIAGGDALRC